MQILVLHGPNLNLLGTREPEVYGSTTLAQIDSGLAEHAARRGATLTSFQSNHEGALIDRVHAGVALPFIEVHLSNVHRREPFRHHSYFSDLAEGVIVGLGAAGYRHALDAALDRLGAPSRD